MATLADILNQLQHEQALLPARINAATGGNRGVRGQAPIPAQQPVGSTVLPLQNLNGLDGLISAASDITNSVANLNLPTTAAEANLEPLADNTELLLDLIAAGGQSASWESAVDQRQVASSPSSTATSGTSGSRQPNRQEAQGNLLESLTGRNRENRADSALGALAGLAANSNPIRNYAGLSADQIERLGGQLGQQYTRDTQTALALASQSEQFERANFAEAIQIANYWADTTRLDLEKQRVALAQQANNREERMSQLQSEILKRNIVKLDAEQAVLDGLENIYVDVPTGQGQITPLNLLQVRTAGLTNLVNTALKQEAKNNKYASVLSKITNTDDFMHLAADTEGKIIDGFFAQVKDAHANNKALLNIAKRNDEIARLINESPGVAPPSLIDEAENLRKQTVQWMQEDQRRVANFYFKTIGYSQETIDWFAGTPFSATDVASTAEGAIGTPTVDTQPVDKVTALVKQILPDIASALRSAQTVRPGSDR